MEKIIINDHIYNDPLHENNLDGILNLVNKIRLLLPDKTIWLYTGYKWNECMEHPIRIEITSKCDVLIDGRYVDSLRDITLRWRGSSNQNCIDVQKSIVEGKLIPYEV